MLLYTESPLATRPADLTTALHSCGDKEWRGTLLGHIASLHFLLHGLCSVTRRAVTLGWISVPLLYASLLALCFTGCNGCSCRVFLQQTVAPCLRWLWTFVCFVFLTITLAQETCDIRSREKTGILLTVWRGDKIHMEWAELNRKTRSCVNTNVNSTWTVHNCFALASGLDYIVAWLIVELFSLKTGSGNKSA